MTDFLQLSVSGLSSGSLYGLIAIGFVAVFSVSGVINMAQGDFAAVAGLLAISLYTGGVSLPMALAIAGVAGTLLAVVMHRTVIAPMKNLTTLQSIILTLGVAIIIRAVLLLAWGPDARGLPKFPGSNIEIRSVVIQSQELWIFGICGLLALATLLFYEKTLPGKALRACAQQPVAASLVGISRMRAGIIAFGIAGFTGAVAGLVASPLYFTDYDSGLILGLKGFVAAAMAGLVSVRGAFIGGLVLGLVEGYMAGYVDSGLRDAVAFVALLAVLIVRPTGILAKKEGARV